MHTGRSPPEEKQSFHSVRAPAACGGIKNHPSSPWEVGGKGKNHPSSPWEVGGKGACASEEGAGAEAEQAAAAAETEPGARAEAGAEAQAETIKSVRQGQNQDSATGEKVGSETGAEAEASA